MGTQIPISAAIRSAALSFSVLFAFADTAQAQSTPTELADMSLEDLLNFDLSSNIGRAETRTSKWDIGYTFRKLSSGGYRSGRQDITFDEVLFSPGEVRTSQNYPVVPTFICQNVHSLSARYSLTSSTSLSVVLPYIKQGTDHISSVPGFSDFPIKSSGIGDIALYAGHQKSIGPDAALHLSAGVRIPTGSINETGDTPRAGSGTLERLPYTMQIGSGTLDLLASVGYSRRAGDFAYGMSANATLRTGMNDNDYRLGNNYTASAWARYRKHHWFQPGARVYVRTIEQIKGGDTSLQVPAAFPFPASITNPDNYGGSKAYLSATLKVCPQKDCKLSLTGELAEPVYQNLNGIQPKDRHYGSISAAIQF